MQISRTINEYARFLATDMDIDSVDIFCRDKTIGSGEVFDLYAYGLDSQIKTLYKNARIFEADPFTDLLVREAASPETDTFDLANDPRMSMLDKQAEKYWRFTHVHEVEVVGAATRRLLPGFHLVIGMHRTARRSQRSEIPVELLKTRVEKLVDMVSIDILQTLLREGDGYVRLQNVMAGPPQTGPGNPDLLSPRESDIARLICLGKQNKEIAYLTGLSEHTVENTLRRIYRKLEIHNRTALASKMSGTFH